MNQIAYDDLALADAAPSKADLQELNDLQLAAIGGGIADTIGV